MRAIILLMGFFILSGAFTSLYAEEKDYELTRISINLEEREELAPDILSMTVEVNANSAKEAEVINILGSIDKALRSLNLNYKGGSYSVYKNCWWEKDRRRCSGYKGELNYSFELKEAREKNKILEVIEESKEKYGEKINYTVSHPQWLISEKKVRDKEKELKLEMIETAMDFAKRAGEKLGKKCSISSINYDVRRPIWEPPVFYKSTSMMEKAMIEAPEPKREDKAVSVKASVGLVCR